jgi:hypothetical protein
LRLERGKPAKHEGNKHVRCQHHFQSIYRATYIA